MRVLGIDPGYAIVGWGVVEYVGNRFTPVAFGAVTTEAGMPFEQRLDKVYEGVLDVMTTYKPEGAEHRAAVLSAQPDHGDRRGRGQRRDSAGGGQVRHSHL